MIVPPDSILHKLPKSIPVRQVLVFDGIRVAAQIADKAFSRLTDKLQRIADNGSLPAELDATDVIEDVWAVVDSVQRLRKLLMGLRGLKQNSPGIQQFYRGTQEVEDLRHGTQHLDERIKNLEASEDPVWGAISWLHRPDRTAPRIASFVLIPGPIRSGNHAAINPAGKPLSGVIDHITLDAFGVKANLSQVMRYVRGILTQLQTQLAEHADPENHYGCDVLLRIDLQLLNDVPEPPGDPVSFEGAI